MHRCLQLADLGAGNVAPNPMVGAVLVNEDRIIGEGWHQVFGQAHAEVTCINSVKPEDAGLISSSVMYVSLEPCAHHGKTPPCADLIIQHKIPRVVVGCRDPFIGVNGKGIEKLQQAGVLVDLGVLENECRELNKRFFTFHTLHRPFIILKWAQTRDGFMAAAGTKRLFISNEYSNRLVHRWRSRESSIMVGTNTALYDDPELTTRLWPGNSPVRVVVDMDLSLPPSLKIFGGDTRTIVFNAIKHEQSGPLLYYRVTKDVNLVHQVLNALYGLNIQSVLVEGGSRLLQSFIDEKAWDEARVITNDQLMIGAGLRAPQLACSALEQEQTILNDRIGIFKPERN